MNLYKHKFRHNDGLRPLQLGQWHGTGIGIDTKSRNQFSQIGFETCQRGGIEFAQCIGQHAGKWRRCARQYGHAGVQQVQGDGAAVGAIAARIDHGALEQGAYQVAGSGLLDVEGARQFLDADAGLVADDGQRPDLGAAQAGRLFDVAEVGFDSVEDDAKLAQHASRGRGRRGRWFDGWDG